MSEKEKNILTEIGDRLKELGEELKPHLDKVKRRFVILIKPSNHHFLN